MCYKKQSASFLEILGEFRSKKERTYDLVIHSSRFVVNKTLLTSWSGKRADISVNIKGLRSCASAIGTFLAIVLAKKDGILVHGCLIERNGNGYVFIGPSGAGKSTIARNARGFLIVTDDICALRIVNGKWMAHGVPMLQNDGRPALPISAELKNIFIITKSNRNRMIKMDPKKSFELFIEQVIIPFDELSAQRSVFETALKLIEAKKPLQLLFRKNLDVSILLNQTNPP